MDARGLDPLAVRSDDSRRAGASDRNTTMSAIEDIIDDIRGHHRRRRFAMKVQQKLDRSLESFIRVNATDWDPNARAIKSPTASPRKRSLPRDGPFGDANGLLSGRLAASRKRESEPLFTVPLYRAKFPAKRLPQNRPEVTRKRQSTLSGSMQNLANGVPDKRR